MSAIREVQDLAKALRERRSALEAQLSGADPKAAKALRMELAVCSEELIDCRRRLRELRPRHRVRHGGTAWTGPKDCRLDKVQYQGWLEEQNEGRPSPLVRLSVDARRAMEQLPERQGLYLAGVAQGETASSLARQYDRDPSTVARTIRRAKRRVRRAAELSTAGRKYMDEEGVLRLDLSNQDHMALLLDRLTGRQQLYLYLYYGEWMTLREIGALLEVDKSTVLRTIRRGLDRLDGLFQAQQIRLDGVGSVEELLIGLYETITTQDLESQRDLHRPKPCGAGGGPRENSGPSEAARLDSLREDRVEAYGSTGRLLAWLEEKKQVSAGLRGWMQKTLLALLGKLKSLLHGREGTSC
ncbi:MAG: hypothetical protein HFE97_11820 [Oscillospiraceae bacterium]|nr:hypothetical protein [Oscillospiraceae bacterium]